jgi:membrane associated rhomboid family serine protease
MLRGRRTIPSMNRGLAARLVGGIAGALFALVLFTPWGRFSACPVRPGVPACRGDWTNLLGWEFGAGGFPVLVPIVASVVGFLVGWVMVALVQRLMRRAVAPELEQSRGR